jgi:hypothetical protein
VLRDARDIAIEQHLDRGTPENRLQRVAAPGADNLLGDALRHGALHVGFAENVREIAVGCKDERDLERLPGVEAETGRLVVEARDVERIPGRVRVAHLERVEPAREVDAAAAPPPRREVVHRERARRGEHAGELAERAVHVRVVEGAGARDEVERAVRKRQRLGVAHRDMCVWRHRPVVREHLGCRVDAHDGPCQLRQRRGGEPGSAADVERARAPPVSRQTEASPDQPPHLLVDGRTREGKAGRQPRAAIHVTRGPRGMSHLHLSFDAQRHRRI